MRNKTNNVTRIKTEKIVMARNLILVLFALQFAACKGRMQEKPGTSQSEHEAASQPILRVPSTTFPQIHTNLNGMVREFVRSMYQDTQGNYWFGTNTNGIIRYDGDTLENSSIQQDLQFASVREIVEDKVGNIWFGTSLGLVKYDGAKFTTFSKEAGLQAEEVWGVMVDASGLVWVGTVSGVSQFDGQKFTPFLLPETIAENAQPMLSDKLVFKIIQDKNGMLWFVTDGNGIFTYKNGLFNHLTTKNGLPDNNASDILEDKQGNIWIGTFYGGVSKFDGKTFTNFTKAGIIEGEETYNFCEDRLGNIWFAAEHHGVYRYDGTNFTQFTTENGLTTNSVQSMMEDNKGQVWFGTWQGICLYDGQGIADAKVKEPWTK
jgi:ligand-binding sensor domain-containing protein